MVLINLMLITTLWPAWQCGSADRKNTGSNHTEIILTHYHLDAKRFLSWECNRKTSMLWTCSGRGWLNMKDQHSAWPFYVLWSDGVPALKGWWINFEGPVSLNLKKFKTWVPWWSDWPFDASDPVLPRDSDWDRITEYHMGKSTNECPSLQIYRKVLEVFICLLHRWI